MKKLLLLMPLLTIVLFATPVQAAEITPAADSYSYGSTSELSPSSTVTIDDDALAPTGQDQAIYFGVAVIAFAGATTLIFAARRNQ